MEQDILYETENFYCFQVGGQIEIRLNKGTHSVVVGTKKTFDAAKKFVDRCEKYPQNLKYLG